MDAQEAHVMNGLYRAGMNALSVTVTAFIGPRIQTHAVMGVSRNHAASVTALARWMRL